MRHLNGKALSIVAVLALGAAGSARGTILGTGGSTEATQVLNWWKLYDTVNKLEGQLSLMRDACKRLSGQDWGHTALELAALDQVVRGSGALAYSAVSLDADYRAKYPGLASYESNQLGQTTMAAKYQGWSQETNLAVLTALRVAGLQAKDFQSEQVTMATLQGFSNSAAGQMQATQAGNQIAGVMVGQLQKLRQLLMTQMQMQGDYMAMSEDRQAAQRAYMRQWTDMPRMDITDGKGF